MQFMGLRDHASESKVSFVIEDSLEEEHAPLNKRCKQWSSSNGSCFSFPSQDHNILDEPSPLGLRLRKSPSLLDLIQAKLSHGDKVVSNEKDESLNSGVKKESRPPVEKLKASNFPATVLRIGSWEYTSKHEGDLVAKCYFAKQKLVWEVLEGELKSKIEIQWADITALKANCPEDGPSTLSIVVARQPLFFRETNPQPRKHTLWQTATDFTGGQAIKSRKHFLQCEQGLLIKHFEKLIQCDERLQYLSQQPEIKLDLPHSDFAFDNHDNLKKSDLDQVNGKGSVTSRFQNMGSPNSSLSPSFTLDSIPCEAASSSSEVINSSEADSKGPKNWDQIKLPGLRPSMSVSDFIGHIEHHLSEEMASGNLSSPAKRMDYNVMLEDIAHHLLNDNHVTTDSDEISLMSRVNSLCCLLQKDPVEVPNSHDNSHDSKSSLEGPNDEKNIQLGHDLESMQSNKTKIDMKAAEEDSRNGYGGHQAPGMSRKDSFGELLQSLPRIASLPKFLFNISED
ncbi:uncharacterized protein LOC127138465 isoform X2 [Lathyrus oleraceus]|uniref:uncharacterized protein LOC127138465 isoform X2 n=1 Tax=Pisum sativum TaxID=3888 RepID=UPI001FC43E3F|nr:uncharacterized protein LOC127138465 isoform X2 [Pisum sativum]